MDAQWALQLAEGARVDVHAVQARAEELWQRVVWHPLEVGPPPAAESLGTCPVRSIPDPGNRTRDGFKLQTYRHWFHAEFCKGTGFAYHLYEQQAIHAISRMWLGAHDLEIERGRFRGNGRVPRDGRVCRCCDMGIREDELHVLLECPAYEAIRAACAPAFETVDAEKPMWVNMQELTHAGSNAARWRAMSEFCVRYEAQRRVSYRSFDSGNG